MLLDLVANKTNVFPFRSETVVTGNVGPSSPVEGLIANGWVFYLCLPGSC